MSEDNHTVAHGVWGHVGSSAQRSRKPSDLERMIPEGLKKFTVTSAGSGEVIFPYAEALQVTATATRHRIAVLGVESFEVRKDGAVLALNCGEYEFGFAGDWGSFVARNNASAESWIRGHRLGEKRGYILTSASRKEFASLKAPESP